MNNQKIVVGGIIAVLIVGGIYMYLTRPPKAPSQSIEDVRKTEQNPESVPNSATSSEAKEVVFKINNSESLVEFNIDEVLRGKDFQVIGTTTEVSGDIFVDIEDLSKSKIEDIYINARTLKTDDSRRDGAISRLILRSESPENEFIEFEPETITGLEGKMEIGKPLTFQVAGDLIISGKTKPVTFDVKVIFESEKKLTGTAESSIKRADFGLVIPNVPFVANVSESVTLKFKFTANQATVN